MCALLPEGFGHHPIPTRKRELRWREALRPAGALGGGQGRGRTVDLPIFRWVRTMRISLDSHSLPVAVSCESLTVRVSAAESVHKPST